MLLFLWWRRARRKDNSSVFAERGKSQQKAEENKGVLYFYKVKRAVSETSPYLRRTWVGELRGLWMVNKCTNINKR